MGMKGWGLATGLQPWATLVVIAPLPLVNEKIKKYFKDCGLFEKPQSRNELFLTAKELIKIGSPIMLQNFFTFGNLLCASLLSGRLGTSEIASFQIASAVSVWSIMLLDPLTSLLSVSPKNKY